MINNVHAEDSQSHFLLWQNIVYTTIFKKVSMLLKVHNSENIEYYH